MSLAFVTATIVTPMPVGAENWIVTPGISVSESWTDNVLSSSRDRKSDYVTSVSPSVEVRGDGNRLDLGLDYRLSYDRYAAHNDLDGMRHNGIASAKAELLEDFFFLDTRGVISEQLINPAGATTAGDRRLEENRVRVGTLSVTPQMRHRFGEWAVGAASYRHDRTEYWTSSANADLPGSTGNSGTLSLGTGENFSRTLVTWQLENIHRKSGSSVFYQTTNTVDGEYRLDRDWGLLAHAGHDALNGTTLDSGEYDGFFYGGGVHWTPSPRTEAKAAIGRRFGGADLFVDASHRLGAFTRVALSHSQGVTTEAQLIASGLDAVERDEQGRFVDPFSGLDPTPTSSAFVRTDRAFKQNTTRLALTHARTRDTLALTGALSTREQQSRTGIATDTTALTLGFSWTHRLTELWRATAGLTQSQILDAATKAGENRVLSARLSTAYLFTPTLSGDLSYSWLDSQPEVGAGITENMVTAGMRKTF